MFWDFFLTFVLSSSPLHQQKQQEIERVDKWLKMLKKWGKYRNSDKVRWKRRACARRDVMVQPLKQALKTLREEPEITGKYCLVLPISLENFQSFLELAGLPVEGRSRSDECYLKWFPKCCLHGTLWGVPRDGGPP